MARGRMWRRLVVSALAAMCCAGGSACGDGDDTEGCFVTPPVVETDAAGTLTYSVSSSPLGQVFKVVYATPEGEKTVEDPKLPFSVQLQVPSGAKVKLEVTGRADQGGSIMAGYSFTNGGLDAFATSETCGH